MLSENNQHTCTSYSDGDWIVWICPQCEGYERRLNWQTGEMKIKSPTNFSHVGWSDKKQNLEGLLPNEIQNS